MDNFFVVVSLLGLFCMVMMGIVIDSRLMDILCELKQIKQEARVESE